MKLFDKDFKLTTGIGIGIGLAIAGPVVVAAMTGMARPMAKALIKGGIMAYDRGMESLAEMFETVQDLAAEARSEMSHEASGMTATSAGAKAAAAGPEPAEPAGAGAKAIKAETPARKRGKSEA